jgi:hypothetical protein
MNGKKNIKKVLTILLLVFVGAVVGFLIGNVLKGGNHSQAALPLVAKIVLFAAIIPAFFFVIAVHEGGHALAGVLLNFDFRLFVTGPFMYEKENDRWHFKWNKNINVAGGLVVCLPKNTFNLSKKFMLFAAGGPIASLVLAVLFYFIYRLITINNPPASSLQNFMTALCIIIAALSAVIFILTSIPLHAGGFYTDGARILRLLRGDETSRLEVLMLTIIATATSGTRPANYNIKEMEEAQRIATKIGDPFSVYFHGLFHQAAFDKGELDKAEQHLNSYIEEIEKIPAGFRSSIWLDAAFFYAYAKKDITNAEYYYAKYKPSPMLPTAQLYATEAMLLKLKNDTVAMQTKIDAALKEIPNMVDKGIAIVLKERLLEMKSG